LHPYPCPPPFGWYPPPGEATPGYPSVGEKDCAGMKRWGDGWWTGTPCAYASFDINIGGCGCCGGRPGYICLDGELFRPAAASEMKISARLSLSVSCFGGYITSHVAGGIVKHGLISDDDSRGVPSVAGEHPPPVLLLPEPARTLGESNPAAGSSPLPPTISGDPLNSLPLAWNSVDRACFSPPPPLDNRLLARVGRRTVTESIVPARFRGSFEAASGFTIHHELLPVPSFCTRINRLCRDRLCRIEFYNQKACIANCHNVSLIFNFSAILCCLQCFDAVGWPAGRASGL